MFAHFEFLDILVFAAYALLLVSSGWLLNRKVRSGSDYFLGGHSMPVWVVAVSVLATSQSAATFLGGPDQGFRGDLTYLSTNIGAIIAAYVVTAVLIPRFYQYRVYTVYELLAQRFGNSSKQRAGLVYLFGRVFASGARLYMAAIAISMIWFGDIAANHVIWSTLLLTLVGLVYTVYGGIRTVIYSDVLQAAIYVSAAIAVIIALLSAIPAPIGHILDALQHPLDGSTSKLRLFDTSFGFGSSSVFSLLSVFTGFVLLNIAAFGLDQDMTQRLLTCKSAKESSKAMLLSVVMVIPVMLLFLTIGLLLYVVYQRPDIMHTGNTHAASPAFAGETVTVFMHYVLTELPAGVRALVTIGIVAAALSTLNSGLNSMASVLVHDHWMPLAAKRGKSLSPQQEVVAGRIGMTLVALALCAMACLCYFWQQHSDMPLLQFALGVMVFSYSGLLGVYFTALFTQRGTPRTITAGLVVGFLLPLSLQPYVQALWLPLEWHVDIGFTWQLLIGSTVATLVCCSRANKTPHQGVIHAQQ